MLFLGTCAIIKQYEQHRISNLYTQNADLLSWAISDENSVYFNRRVKHYIVPPELDQLGFAEIYEDDANIYFMQKNRLLGIFGYGIVFVQNQESIPRWTYITQIADQWYYYFSE